MTTLHYIRHYDGLPDPATADSDDFYYVNSDAPRCWWCRTIWVVGGDQLYWVRYAMPGMYNLVRLARANHREGIDVTDLPDWKPPAIKDGRYVEQHG